MLQLNLAFPPCLRGAVTSARLRAAAAAVVAVPAEVFYGSNLPLTTLDGSIVIVVVLKRLYYGP